MQAVMRSEELKSSQFLLDFLFETDFKVFAKILKDSEKILGPKKLDDYVTANGLARVLPSASTTQFCLRMPDYIDSHKLLYQEMIECASEVQERSGELANSLLRLHKNLE
jgi:regulator of sigma D